MDRSAEATGSVPAARGDCLPWPAILAFCLLPTVQTVVPVYLEFYTYVTYPLLKGLMIVGPLAVWWLARRPMRQVLRDVGLRRTNCLRGVLLGLLLVAAIVGGHYLFVRGLVDPQPIRDKIQRLALGGPGRFLAMVLVISLANSLFEEYYWRGFVLDQWRERLAAARHAALWPCVLAAGFFGAHHVVALLPMVGPAFVAAGTLATVAAGLIWSWLRLKGWSLWDCYVSHVLADFACLWVGWDLIGGRF